MSLSRTLLAAAALAGSLAAPALAQGPISNPSASAVTPGAYAVEPTHTRVLFKVSHMGFTNWYGDFAGVTGTLTLDPRSASVGAVQVTIPVDSVTGPNAKLNGELKSADWFGAEAFPTITFKSTSVKRTGASTADVTGDLTFHGVTKPVVLHATLNGSGANVMNKHVTVGFDATARISRSAFGVSRYVPVVGDDVDLMISAAFEKTGG